MRPLRAPALAVLLGPACWPSAAAQVVPPTLLPAPGAPPGANPVAQENQRPGNTQ